MVYGLQGIEKWLSLALSFTALICAYLQAQL